MSSSENLPMASGLSQESTVDVVDTPITIEAELASYKLPGVDPLLLDTLKTKFQEQQQLESSIISSKPLIENQKALVNTAIETEKSGQAIVDSLAAKAIEAQNLYATKKSNSNTTQAKYDTLLEQKPKIQEAEAAAQEVREVEAQARALFEEKTGALSTVELNVDAEMKKMKELEETLDRLEFDQDRLKELEGDLGTQRSAKDGITSVIQGKTEQLATLTEQLPGLEKTYTDAVHLEASLTTAQQQMALEEATMKDKVAAQEVIQSSIEGKRKEIEGIEADILVKQEASDTAATARDVLSRKLQKLASIQAEIDTLQKSSTELGSSLVSLEDSMELATEKYNASVAAAAAAKEKLDQLLAIQKDISDAEATVLSLEQTRQSQGQELTTKQQAIPGLESAVAEATTVKTTLEGQKASLTGLGEQVGVAEGVLVAAATAEATAAGLLEAQKATAAAATAAVTAAAAVLSQKVETLRALAQLQADISAKSDEVTELDKKVSAAVTDPAKVALLANLKAQFDADTAYSSSIASAYAALQQRQLQYTQALLNVQAGKMTAAVAAGILVTVQSTAESLIQGLLDDRRAYEAIEKAKIDAGIQVGLPCTGVAARHLVVGLSEITTVGEPMPAEPLSFSQIAVYNTNGINVALRKPVKASQPTAAGSAGPEAAVDGIMAPRADSAIYKAATIDVNSKWEVDFGAMESIAYVVVVAPKENILRLRQVTLSLYDGESDTPIATDIQLRDQFKTIECIPFCPEAIARMREPFNPYIKRLLASAYLDMTKPGTPVQARYLRLQPSLDWGDGFLSFGQITVLSDFSTPLGGTATAFSAADGFGPELPLSFAGRPRLETKGAYRSTGNSRSKEFWLLDFGKLSPVGIVGIINTPVINLTNRQQIERPIGVRASLLDENMDVVATTTFKTADLAEFVSFYPESLEKRRTDDDVARVVQQSFIAEEIERLRVPLGLATGDSSPCTPVRAKKLRVIPTWDIRQDTNLMFSQIAVYNTKGENVALRRPATATNYDGIFTPDVAVDGEMVPRTVLYFKSMTPSRAYLKWDVTFDKEEDITHVILVAAALGGTTTDINLKGMRFELLDSDEIVVKRNLARKTDLLQVIPFCEQAIQKEAAAERDEFEKTTLVDLRKELMEDIKESVTPVKARYIRMLPSAFGLNGFIMTCSQILVYGPDDTNIALNKPVTASPGMYNTFVNTPSQFTTYGVFSPPTTITDGNIRPKGFRDVFQSAGVTNSSAGYIEIDLGLEQDITHLVYINRSDTNTDSARGLRFQLLNSTQTVIVDRTLSYDTDGTNQYQILGFTPEMIAAADRKSIIKYQANLTKMNPITTGTQVTPVRGRYIQISAMIADSSISTAKTLRLSQVVVFSDTGVNIALRKRVTAFTNEIPLFPTRLLTDGYYEARAGGSGFTTVYPNLTGDAYLEIDLGEEMNVSNIGFISPITSNVAASIQLTGVSIAVLNANRQTIAIRRTGTVSDYISGYSMTPESINTHITNYQSQLASSAFMATINSLRTTNKVSTTDSYTPYTARYIRILPSETSTEDIMNFSQILVFNNAGINVAYMKPVTGIAASVLQPGNLITDGTIVSRASTACYLSNGINRTSLLEIDLLKDESVAYAVLFNNNTTGPMARSQGLRLQILDSNKCVIAQRVFTTAEEVQLVSLTAETENALRTKVFDETANKATLDIVNSQLSTYSMPAAGQACTPIKARFMQIYPNTYSSTESVMFISEVMVYNTAGRNIARERPAFAPNQNSQSRPSNATNGNYLSVTTGSTGYGSITSGRGISYLEIDWGLMEDLRYAVIVNQAHNTATTAQARVLGIPVLFFNDKRELVHKSILRRTDNVQIVPLCLQAITAEATKQAALDAPTYSSTITAINNLKTQYSITDTSTCTGPTARYVRIRMPQIASYSQQLTISQIQVFNANNVNVALMKPTKANSTNSGGLHHGCVTDGVLTPRISTLCYRSAVSATQTPSPTSNNEAEYVQVDLQKSEMIRYVVVISTSTATRDIFKARVQLLDDTEKIISEKLLETNDAVQIVNFCKEADDRRRAADLQTRGAVEQKYTTIMDNLSAAMQPNNSFTPVRGRYVRMRPSLISRDANQKLTGTQIMVFNKAGANIAFKCPVDATHTTLSTANGIPARLTDGELTGLLPYESIIDNRFTEYAEVDLGSEQDILHIVYFNRTDTSAGTRAVGLRFQVLDANRNLVKEKQLLTGGARELLCMASETEAAEEKALADARYQRNKTTYDLFPQLLKTQAFIEDGQTYTPTPARYMRIVPSELANYDTFEIRNIFIYNDKNTNIALNRSPIVSSTSGSDLHTFSADYITRGEIDGWTRFYKSRSPEIGTTFIEIDFGKVEKIVSMIVNLVATNDSAVLDKYNKTRIQLLDENRNIIRERFLERPTVLQALSFCDETIPKEFDSIRTAKISALQTIVNSAAVTLPCKGVKARKVILRPSIPGDGYLNFTRIQVFNTKGEMVSKNKYINLGNKNSFQPGNIIYSPSEIVDDNTSISANVSTRSYSTQGLNQKWTDYVEIDLGGVEEIMYVIYYNCDTATSGSQSVSRGGKGTRLELTDDRGRLIGLRTVTTNNPIEVVSFCETDVAAEILDYESAQSGVARATLPATINTTCTGIVGRKIRIRPSATVVNANTGGLNLSQIMAFGSSGKNLVLGKRVITSAMVQSALYQMITDGVAAARGTPSIASTSGNSRTGEFITVDLDTDVEISYIIIYNRSDSPKESLSGARVQILDTSDKVLFEGTLAPTTADVYSISTCAAPAAAQAGGGTIEKVLYDPIVATLKYLKYVGQFKLNTDKAVDKLKLHIQAIIDSTGESKASYDTLKGELDGIGKLRETLVASYNAAERALESLKSGLVSTYGDDLTVHTVARGAAETALTDAQKSSDDQMVKLNGLTADAEAATAAKAAAEQALASARGAQTEAVKAMGELNALIEKIIDASAELSRRQGLLDTAKGDITTLEGIISQTEGLLTEARVKVDGKRGDLKRSFGQTDADWEKVKADAAAADAAKNLDSQTIFQIGEQLGKTQSNSQYTADTFEKKKGELLVAQKDVEGQSLDLLTQAAQDKLVELQNALRALEKARAELVALEEQLRLAAAAATEQIRIYEEKRAAFQGIIKGEGGDGAWIRTQRLAAEKVFQESVATKAMLEQDILRLKGELEGAEAKYTELEGRVNVKLEEIRKNYSMNAGGLEDAAVAAAESLRSQLALKDRAIKDADAAKATFFAATSAREMADSNLTKLLESIRLQYGNNANLRTKLDESLVQLRLLELDAAKAADELNNYQAIFATMKAERTKAEVELAKMVAAVEVAEAKVIVTKKEVIAARADIVAAVAVVKAAEEAAAASAAAAELAAAEEAAKAAAAAAAEAAAAAKAAAEAEVEAETKRLAEEKAARNAADAATKAEAEAAAAKAAEEAEAAAEAKRIADEVAAKAVEEATAAAAAVKEAAAELAAVEAADAAEVAEAPGVKEEDAIHAADAAAAAEAAKKAAEDAAIKAAADAAAAAAMATEIEAQRLAEEAESEEAAQELQSQLEDARAAVDSAPPLDSFTSINTPMQNPMEYLEQARNSAEEEQRTAAALRNAQLAAAREINALSTKVNTNGKTLNELLMEIGGKMKELRTLKDIGIIGADAGADVATATSTDNAGEWKDDDEPIMSLSNLATSATEDPFFETETWSQMAERMGYLGSMSGGQRKKTRRGRRGAPARKTHRRSK